MATSRRYYLLKCRINELKRNMLPGVLSPIGSYSDKTYDRVRGFRLLVHAEIEDFIEQSVKEKASVLVGQWIKNSVPSDCVISLVLFYYSSWTGDNNNPIVYANVQTNIKEIAQKALNCFHSKIKENHGIKKENLKNLLVPVGINMDDLDVVWVVEMENYGIARGVTAHTSKKTSQPPDPQYELRKIGELLLGLKTLDEKIRSLC